MGLSILYPLLHFFKKRAKKEDLIAKGVLVDDGSSTDSAPASPAMTKKERRMSKKLTSKEIKRSSLTLSKEDAKRLKKEEKERAKAQKEAEKERKRLEKASKKGK